MKRFVKILENNKSFEKKANPMSAEKLLLIAELIEAIDNLKLIKEEKLRAKPARQLLNEF